ncbi:MAG TPA: sulfatase [Opitutaceae bacterium]|nr:sulfatase [Opitutaceae bacterium]
MIRISSIVALAVLGGASAGISTGAQTPRPNILWIMADDHAVTGVGAYGGRLASLNPTPNIDRLAREGVRLTNAFCTNSICTPARATLLTGQYSHQNGVRTLNDPLPPARQTLPPLIKAAGYATAMIGKWHLHEEPATFDFYSVLPGQGWYANPVFLQKDRGEWPHNEFRFAGYDNKHSEDAVADLSLAWLKQRDASKPFFLMCHFKAPHDNFENAERYDFLYDDATIPEPASLRRTPNHGSEATKGTGTSVGKRNARRNMGQHMFVDPELPAADYQRVAYQRYLKKYLRCVKGIDDNVGRLLAQLEATGELDHTIVFYTSDQGFMLGEHDYIDKRWMYEESLRVPFLVRYPPTIRPGTTSDAMVNNVDFAETLLDFAGAPIPATMQGRSARPVLEGRVPADWPTATYYRYWMHMAHHENPAHYGIRTRDHKLIFFYGLPLDASGAPKNPTTPGWELYDLRRDPEELHNVYGDPAYAAAAAQLKAELLRLKERVGDRDEKYPALMAVREHAWDK